MIAATTPTGSRTSVEVPTSSSHTNSEARCALSANVNVGSPAWMPLASMSGIPTSLAMHSAMSSPRSASFSEMRVSSSPRSLGLVFAHDVNAAAAASTAAFASSTVPAGIVA